MKPDFRSTDSLIFDMDGTLWDAIASYWKVWEICFAKRGIEFPLSIDDVGSYMGHSIDEIFDDIVRRTGVEIDRDGFIDDISEVEDEQMPKLGGRLYDGVQAGLQRLSQHYRLFMVSNCSKYGLKNFMAFSGTTGFFTGSVSFGERQVPKSENIRYIIEKYRLLNPVYVGDTQGDCNQAHKAGIPFVYATYGFGSCDDYDMAITNFNELVDNFLK